jgi:hypothetical protein
MCSMQLGKTKAIKHTGGYYLLPQPPQPKLIIMEGRKPQFLSMAMGQHGCCPWFVYLRGYTTPVGSKHKSKSLFQNLGVDITKVQTLRGIILLGGDFNARITTILDTIDISDLCELLQAPELVETQQPSVVAKQQNCDASVGNWGCKFLHLCCDVRLFIFNG